MKTITKELYEYQDLIKPENSKILERVLDNWALNDDNSFIWSEAEKTIKSFLNIINVNIKTYNSWLEPSFGKIDDNILELSGLRLRTWFINNFDFLWKPKYIGSPKTNEHIKHKRIKSPINVNSVGNRFNPYYSGCQLDNCCVLTGMCYDDDFLSPIYDFIKKPTNKNFEDLIKDCFNSLEETINNEIEWRESKEYILEEIANCDYTFNELGEIEY